MHPCTKTQWYFNSLQWRFWNKVSSKAILLSMFREVLSPFIAILEIKHFVDLKMLLESGKVKAMIERTSTLTNTPAKSEYIRKGLCKGVRFNYYSAMNCPITII
jgi:hypothetical protein